MIVLAVDVNSSPVIGIIFWVVVVIVPKFEVKDNPTISKKLAKPTTIPSLFNAVLASKVGVFIVIAPPAATANVLTVADTSSSPVTVILAIPVTVSSPWEIFNCSPLIDIGAPAVIIILLAVEVNWVKAEVANILPLPVRTKPNPSPQAPVFHSSLFQPKPKFKFKSN